MANRRHETQNAHDRVFMDVWGWVRWWLLLCCGLSCPVVVGYQILGWLKTGHWRGIALADWIGRNQSPLWQWIYEPHSWYGLHVIVKFSIFDLPVWFWLVVIFYMTESWMGSKERTWSRSVKAHSEKD
jgi:hypothetical protein